MGDLIAKTVREWIETLPEYIRDRAMANVRAQGMEERLGVKVYELRGAIISAFGWRGTPEGKRFWGKVSNGEHPKIKRRVKYRERFAELEREVQELKEAQVATPQSSAHRSTPVPDADAGPLTWRIRSVTSLNTKHPRTFTVEDKLNDKGSVKEIVLKKWIDGAVYEGYSFDGELVFRYGTEYATVRYFIDC